jgi:Phospholipase/Carboxylesterase
MINDPLFIHISFLNDSHFPSPTSINLAPFPFATAKQTNKMPPPTALIVPAIKRHTATVIMAHGLGDNGAGWVGLAENWRRRQKFEEVKFIFPNAPAMPITIVRSPPTPHSLHISSRHRKTG